MGERDERKAQRGFTPRMSQQNQRCADRTTEIMRERTEYNQNVIQRGGLKLHGLDNIAKKGKCQCDFHFYQNQRFVDQWQLELYFCEKINSTELRFISWISHQTWEKSSTFLEQQKSKMINPQRLWENSWEIEASMIVEESNSRKVSVRHSHWWEKNQKKARNILPNAE